MIDWVSIVRHSRRRFSNYVGGRAPIRMKRRRRTPVNTSHPFGGGGATVIKTSPQHERSHYSCCCTQVSGNFFEVVLYVYLNSCRFIIIIRELLHVA